MQCPRCQHENPPQAKFCLECGAGFAVACAQCGTQLTFETEDFPNEIDVTICSLDDPESVRPKDQTWLSSKLSWVVLDNRLPQHRTSQSGR